MSWILKSDRNEELDYEHFGPPFLLNVDKVLARIRNLTVRELPDGTLFPVEMSQYDPWVIREALHNASPIRITGCAGVSRWSETPAMPDSKQRGHLFAGQGGNGDPAGCAAGNLPQSAVGRGDGQLEHDRHAGRRHQAHVPKAAEPLFPLAGLRSPEPSPGQGEMQGRILDERYTRLLMAKTDLDLFTIILLDKVQKRRTITPEEHRSLKARKLVEGRYPNVVVAAKVAAAVGEKAKHIRDRGFEGRYYRDLILELIKEHQPVTREDIDRLLLDKLPEVLSEEQKLTKIHNLLSSLSGRENSKHRFARRPTMGPYQTG